MEDRGLNILVVDDEKPIRKILNKLLVRGGYRIVEAANGREGLELFRERRPDIVITDIRMPEMGGLDLLMAIKKESPDACVAVMTGYGSEEVAIQAIRSGACNYFKKPFNTAEFMYAIGVLAELVGHRKGQKFDNTILTGETKTFLMGSRFSQIYPVISELTRTLADYPFDVESVQIALLEMITNAIEHGNLEISLEEKQKALQEGTLKDLYRIRTASPECAGRKVEIHYEFTPARAAFTITDEGKGFVCASLPDPSDPRNIMEVSGRGIIMTRLLMDETKYNDKGNAVTVVKVAGKPEPA